MLYQSALGQVSMQAACAKVSFVTVTVSDDDDDAFFLFL
jgi:hypothetical protein